MTLRFEWDAGKATANLRKHRVSFEEASTAFYDENALVIPDPDHAEDEERFVLRGSAPGCGLLWCVTATERRKR